MDSSSDDDNISVQGASGGINNNFGQPGRAIMTNTFCPRCSSRWLVIKADREKDKIMHACRICAYEEPAGTHCALLKEFNREARKRKHLAREMLDDPTRGKTQRNPCPKCKGKEAVFFRVNDNPYTLDFNYVCTNKECEHIYGDE